MPGREDTFKKRKKGENKLAEEVERKILERREKRKRKKVGRRSRVKDIRKERGLFHSLTALSILEDMGWS